MRPITLLLPAPSPAARTGGRAPNLHTLLHGALELALATPVTLVTLHPALFAQVLEGTSDAIAWAPPLVARDLLRLRLATPLATADGGAEYAATLVGRLEIESLAGIARQRVGWVSKLSATGYQIPRMYLESFGLDVQALFASERFYGSHAAVARALAEGAIDVAATHSGRLANLLGTARGRILTSIGPVPADLIMGSAGLAPEAREAARRALSGTTAGPYRFRYVRPSHLDLFDLLQCEAPAPRSAVMTRESGVMLSGGPGRSVLASGA